MRTRGLLVAVVFGLLLGASPAAPADQPDPAAVTKAKELLAVTKSIQTADSMTDTIFPAVEKLVEAANPGRAAEVRMLMEKYFLPEMRKHLPEFGDLVAAEWARYFTVAEMDQMLAFYRTDVGQKVIALQPTLFKESYELGQAWGETMARDVFRKIAPELERQGLKSPNI
ncbi:MAG TPA: DUF2059 domain-containing protein [Dongiaceae bacterium]|nr:DUF2059 domain-containing protein [Dongiaceae bacterium]